MFRAISIDYDFTQVLQADYDQHSETPIVHQQEQQDIYREFGGFPGTYHADNTRIHQLCWQPDQLDFELLGRMTGIEVLTVSSIRQDPGNVNPYHRDLFYQTRKRYPERQERLVRANVFLEQNRLGHMMQFTVDQQHRAVTEWQANTGFVFDSTILHLSCNAGLEPKFTLQISGFCCDK